MTKQQEFRKQTEEAKFKAFSLMCKKVADLEEENNKLLDVISNYEIKVADLEQQIEKMKCCRNCKHPSTPVDNTCVDCENYSKWKLRR